MEKFNFSSVSDPKFQQDKVEIDTFKWYSFSLKFEG